MGRPSKGDRDVFYTRPPRAVGNAIRAESVRRGMTMSDYIAAILANAHDMPELAPAEPPAHMDEELPLRHPA